MPTKKDKEKNEQKDQPDKSKNPASQLAAMRYAKMTPEERSAAAKHAINSRWKKVKQATKKATKKK